MGRGLRSAKCAEEVAPVPCAVVSRCATHYHPRAKSTLLTEPGPTTEPPRYPRVDMVSRPALVPSCTRLCRFPGREVAFRAKRALASRSVSRRTGRPADAVNALYGCCRWLGPNWDMSGPARPARSTSPRCGSDAGAIRCSGLPIPRLRFGFRVRS
jgi:hypothetical protein